MPMETVVILAIGVLCLIFFGSLTALIVICQQRYCKGDFFFKHLPENNEDTYYSNNIELDDVAIHPEIDRILKDSQWVDDATGLIPHCLAILKGCHHLTEKLVAATVSIINYGNDSQKKLWEIIKIAQKISPRVDDVLQSMYPPLDGRLLEARCLSLILSVTNLALVIKYMFHIKGEWIDDSLGDLEEQMKILKDARQSMECCSSGGTINDSFTEPNESDICEGKA